MPQIDLLQIFQGIATLVASAPSIMLARVVLIMLASPSSTWAPRARSNP